MKTAVLVCLGLCLVPWVGAQSAQETRQDGSLHGGEISSPAEGCWSAVELELIEQYGDSSSGAASSVACDAPAGLYHFYPVGATMWQDLSINNFNDLDLSSPGKLDFECTDYTYDGHDATDADIRSFGEQEIGVPVFAAMDGVVTFAHDGQFDQNTGPSSEPANRVAIDHGNGRVAWYFHLKKNSVAVSVGERVEAGQQIGLVGSSGNSSGPHLHFSTYDNDRRYEPFSGICRPGMSGWRSQSSIPRALLLHNFGLSRINIGAGPGLPFELPRTGHFGFGDSVYQFWIQLQNLPASATFDMRLRRPNGSVAATYQGNFPNTQLLRYSWWWGGMPTSPDLHTIAGTWTLEMDIAGQSVIHAPFEVQATYNSSFNRAPKPVTVRFDPPNPVRAT